MSDPIRLQILKALTLHLEGINPDNGYTDDLRGVVFRGRNLLGANDKTKKPALSLIESPTPDIAMFTGEFDDYRRDNWTLLIMGLVADDPANPSDPAYIMADIVTKRLGRLTATKSGGRDAYPDEFMLGGLISSLNIAPPIVRNPDDKVSSTAYFYLPIRVGVVDDLSTG